MLGRGPPGLGSGHQQDSGGDCGADSLGDGRRGGRHSVGGGGGPPGGGGGGVEAPPVAPHPSPKLTH